MPYQKLGSESFVESDAFQLPIPFLVEGRDPDVTDRLPPRLAAVIVRLLRCQDELQDQQREAVKK